MKLSFRGKSAVVTGASGGMGLKISEKLSKNNISVLMLDIQNYILVILLKIDSSIFGNLNAIGGPWII